MKHTFFSSAFRSGFFVFCVLLGSMRVGFAASVTQNWDVGTTVVDAAHPVSLSTIDTESVFLFTSDGTFTSVVPLWVKVCYYGEGNDDPFDADDFEEIGDIPAGRTISVGLGDWDSVRIFCSANETDPPLVLLPGTSVGRNASNQMKISGTLYSGTGYVTAIFDGSVPVACNGGSVVTGSGSGTPVTCVPYGLSANAFHTWKLVATNDTGMSSVATGAKSFFNGNVSVVVTSGGDEGTLTPGIFTISRADVDSAKAQPLEVFYTVSGTAVADKDYLKLSGKVTIPKGEASVIVPVSPLFNGETSVDTTVTLTLGDGLYLWDPAAATATMTITNGDEMALTDVYVDSLADFGNGTIEHPFGSLQQGCTVAGTNSTIWVRGGKDRSYAFRTQADVIRIVKDNVSIRAWGTDGREPIGYEDLDRMAVVTIGDGWAESARNEGYSPFVVEGSNVTIRGLRFLFKSALLHLRENNKTLVDMPLIRAAAGLTVDTCEFLQLDDTNGHSAGFIGGLDPGFTGFSVRGCWFHSETSRWIGNGVIATPWEPSTNILFSIAGNRFDNLSKLMSPARETSRVSLSFISNRVVNCANASKQHPQTGYDGFICQIGNSGPASCELAYNIFYRDKFNDGRTYYAFSHGGGYGNSFYGKVLVHHNTVLGYDGFLVTSRDFRCNGGEDLWTPQVFDNIVIPNPDGGAIIVEHATGEDLKPWYITTNPEKTNSSGYLPGSIFRDNAYKGLFNGGAALNMPGYDLLSCLALSNNVVFQSDPRFLTNVIAGLDGYRFLDAAYPWCTNGWTGENGDFPPYYGALAPVSADWFAEEPYPPFLSEIDVVKSEDLGFVISGALAAGAGKLEMDLDGVVIPLTEGRDVNAVFEYKTAVSLNDVLETNTCYAVIVNATNRFGKADSRSWHAAFLTGEVRIEGTYDARENQLRPGRFTISRPNGYGACRHPLTVFYEVTATGTAQPGIDYEPLDGSIVIPAGETAAFLDVTPILNPSVTENTTIEVRLLDYYYYLSDEGTTATIQIRDNTPATGDIFVDSLAGNGESGPEGEYEGNGTLEDPYREIQEAAFTAKRPGDVIHVNCGEGRAYLIENELDLITIATSNVTIRSYVIDGGKVVDDAGLALVEISENLGSAVDSPSVVSVPVGCDGTTISGLDFRYYCKSEETADGNSLGNGGHVINVSGKNCRICKCAFRQSGTGKGVWGGNRPVYAGCSEHVQEVGRGMIVEECRFENIRGGGNEYAINASLNQDIIGNTFTNCQYCFWPLKAGWAEFDFVSNRVIDCKTIKTTGPNYNELPIGNFGYNIFKTSTGEPFITKGPYGLDDASVQATLPVRIHHNTILGNGPLIRVDSADRSVVPTWAPLIYNNLLVQIPGTTNIVETGKDPSMVSFADGCFSSFLDSATVGKSGAPAAYFATNSMQAGVVFNGGNITMVANYDISKGLNVFDNDEYELDAPPRFLSTDPESPDFCRYIGAEYPQFIFCVRKDSKVRARFYRVYDWIGAQKPFLFEPGTQLFFR